MVQHLVGRNRMLEGTQQCAAVTDWLTQARKGGLPALTPSLSASSADDDCEGSAADDVC